jgi:hypothetical protein
LVVSVYRCKHLRKFKEVQRCQEGVVNGDASAVALLTRVFLLLALSMPCAAMNIAMFFVTHLGIFGTLV